MRYSFYLQTEIGSLVVRLKTKPNLSPINPHMLRRFEHILRITILCCLALIAGTALCSAQTDTTFWFVAPEVANSHGDRPVAFRVTSQGQAATVTLSMPANPNFSPVTWNVPANGTRSVIYSNNDTLDIIENKPHNTLLNKGFLIESTSPITAYYEVVTGDNNPDIFALKGRNALGTDFLVPSQNDMANAHGQERIDIVAIEDNTTIQIIPTSDLTGTGTDTVFITLNRGQTYSVRANSTNAAISLRGTQIKANKKIAVTIIDDSVRGGDIFQGGGCFDLLGDQLIPTNIIGNDYIAIRGFLNLVGGSIREKVYILARDNNTQVFINGVNVTTLQARQTHVATFTTDQMFISSVGGPIYVMHITGFGCETGMAILPPISCTGSTQVGFTRTTNERFGLYVYTETGNQGNIILNNNNSLIQAADFIPVPNSNNAWVYARKELSVAQLPINSGNLIVSSSGKFHLGIINGDNTTGCRYGFFSDFARYTIETSTNSSSADPICEGDTLRVWADSIAGATQFTWNTPQGVVNGREIIIPSLDSTHIGMYRAFAIVDGCQSEEDTVYVGLKPLPGNPNARNTGPYCVGSTLQLQADSIENATYSWTGPNGFSSNLRNPIRTNATVADSGTYQLTLTLNGCSGEAHSTQVSVFPIPNQPNASAVAPALCPGDTLQLQLDSVAGATYIWTGPNGFNSNQRNPVIIDMRAVKAGNYFAQITVNGCTSIADTVLVSLLPGPLAIAVLAGNLNSCQGDTVALRISPAFGNSYQWFRNGVAVRAGGVNDTLLQVTTTGSYQVEATSIFGCTDTATRVQVNVNPQANVTITPSLLPPTICQGDSINLSVHHAAGYSYQWFLNNDSIAGATDSLVRIHQAGQYTISITDSNGCVSNSSAATTVQVIQPPLAQITPSATQQLCSGSSLLLRATVDSFATYRWLRNGQLIAAATDSLLNVDSAGLYQLILTYNSGCTDTSQITEIILLPKPVASLVNTGVSLLCGSDSIRLAGPSTANLNYRWFRNNTEIPGAIDSVFFALQNGSYRVEVTNSSGCRDTSAAFTIVSSTLGPPSILGSSNRQICSGDSLTLVMQPSTVGSLQWFRNGNILVGAIDSQITVNQAGNYQLQIMDTLGCSRLSDTILVSFFAQPTASITPQTSTTFCAGSQVVLQANVLANHNYQWLRDGNPILNANNNNFSAAVTGNYRVIITSQNGCIDTSSAVAILVNPIPVVSLATARTVACLGDTIILRATSDSGFVYQWLRNGTAIPNAQADTFVSVLPGQYAVVVTDTNNCTAVSQQLALTRHPAANNQVQVQGPLSFCTGDSVSLQLTPTLNARYQWFRDGIILPNDTLSLLTVAISGNYQVQITSPQGCLDSSLVFPVTAFPLPIASVQAIPSDSLCVGDTLSLQAINTAGLNLQWLRNGSPLAGQNSAILQLSQAGNYQLVVTNATNCSDSSSLINIRMRPQPLATLVLNGNTQICQGESTLLQGPVSNNLQYQWFRNGVLLANSADSLRVTSSGQYTLRVVDGSGCSDTAASVQIVVDTLPIASISPAGSISFCPGSQQLLQAPIQAGMNYLWFRDGLQLPGTTNTSIIASLPGDYQLVVVNPITGCRDSSSVTQIQHFTAPNVSISTNDSTMRCAGETVRLQANSTDLNLTIQWLRNGVNIPGASNPAFTALQSGNYQVIVTNPQGCRDTSNSISVTILSRPTAVVLQTGPFFLCSGEILNLQVPVQPNVNYQWFNLGVAMPGETNPNLVVTSTGIYSCTVTAGSGCGNLSQDVEVTFRIQPDGVQAAANSPICNGSDINLTASPSPGNSYRWRGPNNFSSNQQNPTLLNAGLLNRGWYYCQVERNGCSSIVDSVFVQVEPPLPVFSIKGRTRLCTGNPLILEVEEIVGASYTWTNPAGQQQNSRRFEIAESWLTDSGTYTVDLNINNCPAPPQGVRVTVNDHNFYFPTAFTPNNDGLNDVFKPATFYQGEYDLRIYDRWGALVFQSNDPQAFWDGSVFGGPGQASAYNYVLFYEGCVREKEVIRGTVLLIR